MPIKTVCTSRTTESEQSKDADTATKALRSFAKWINGRKIGPTLKEKLREILAAL